MLLFEVHSAVQNEDQWVQLQHEATVRREAILDQLSEARLHDLHLEVNQVSDQNQVLVEADLLEVNQLFDQVVHLFLRAHLLVADR